MDPAPPSPAAAINLGIREARGQVIGVLIDGARIASPGLIHFAHHGANLYDRAVVATLGWYIGGDFQRFAQQWGYDASHEDTLLQSVDWPSDGYRLFDISALDESSVDGWFYPLQESNALFMTREMWALIGNVDEGFKAPGGGFLNLDTYRRAIALPGAEPVILLGEGTFHQVHNGIATNATPDELEHRLAAWKTEYHELRGHDFQVLVPQNKPTYLGTLSRNALVRLTRAAVEPIWPTAHGIEPPLGLDFDPGLWINHPIRRSPDPQIAAVIDLIHQEMRAKRLHTAATMARLLRAKAHEEPEPRRLTALLGPLAPADPAIPDLGQHHHSVLAECFELLGDFDNARTHRQLAGNPAGHPPPGLIAKARRSASRIRRCFSKS